MKVAVQQSKIDRKGKVDRPLNALKRNMRDPYIKTPNAKTH